MAINFSNILSDLGESVLKGLRNAATGDSDNLDEAIEILTSESYSRLYGTYKEAVDAVKVVSGGEKPAKASFTGETDFYAWDPRLARVDGFTAQAGKDTQAFTFAFDSEKYSSQYRITVYAQEFIALALKSESDFNKKSRTIYGEIKDVIPENNEILIYRYVSNKGVRDVYPMSIDLSSLLGVYRYDLEIEYKDTSEDEEETESNEKSPE